MKYLQFCNFLQFYLASSRIGYKENHLVTIINCIFRTQYMVFKTQMPIQDITKPLYILSYTMSEWKRKSKFMKTKMKWTMQQFYAKRVSLILYSLITRNSLEWGKWLCCRYFHFGRRGSDKSFIVIWCWINILLIANNAASVTWLLWMFNWVSRLHSTS